MTKMDEEDMSGGEAKVDIPMFDQTESPCGGSGPFSLPKDSTPEKPKNDFDSSLVCAECNKLILEKYYMKVDGRLWHEHCVNCTKCGNSLSESCFVRDSRFYCKGCYIELRHCHRCSGSLTGDELVMRVAEDSYHVICFLCDYCNRQLQVGDKYYCLHETTNRKICCKTCYDMDDVINLRLTETDSEDSTSERDVFSPLHSPGCSSNFMTSQSNPFNQQLTELDSCLQSSETKGSTTSSAVTSSNTSSESKPPKRARTILTTSQRKKFKASFEISQKPCRKVRETLASETGLTPRVVQVWFQNQRAKMKKIARKQSVGDGSSSRKGRKRRDPESDSENELPASPCSFASATTPHQNAHYSDYHSPGSGQSTSALEDQASRILSPLGYQQQFDQSFDAMSHPMVASSPEVEVQRMLQEGVNLSHDVMRRHNENFLLETAQGSYATQRSNDVSLLPSITSNPLDSLMCMQRGFFKNA